MEPVLLLLGAGLIGGSLVAIAIGLGGRRPARPGPVDDTRLSPAPPSLINMAHIRVDGVGGLGMLAMAIVVAIFDPRIRSWMAVAAVLGVMLAVALIAWRRRSGPLPLDGTGPGAHAMFPFDASERRRRPDGGNGSGRASRGILPACAPHAG